MGRAVDSVHFWYDSGSAPPFYMKWVYNADKYVGGRPSERKCSYAVHRWRNHSRFRYMGRLSSAKISCYGRKYQ